MLKLEETGWMQAIAFATMLVSSIAIFWYSLANPIDNWDMLAYAGSVLSLGDTDPIALHAAVYSEMQAFTSEAQFEALTESTPYRTAMYEDAAAFSQQIPFFKIRALFVWMLWAATQTGLGAYEAMHLLSAGFTSAAFFIAYLAFRKHVHSLFWVISPYLYYEFTQSLYVPRSGGVDSLSFFWVALICIAYVKHRRVLLPLLAVSVLVRTDLILFIAPLFLLLFLEDRSTWRQLLFWGITTIALYLGVNNWAGNYGWHTVVYYAFVTDMQATHPEIYSNYRISLSEYLNFLIEPRYWINNWFWVGLGAAIVAVPLFHFKIGWISLKGNTTSHQMQRLVIIGAVCLLYSVAHYLLFPAIFMRFFFGHCLLMVIVLMSVLTLITSPQYESNPLAH